jgi:dipeptidyl-peptidase-3
MHRIAVISSIILALLLGSLGCGKREVPDINPVVVERDGDIAFVSIRSPGFEKLSLQDKQIAYHLSKAAIAGRDLAYDQSSVYALEIKDILEQIIVHPRGIPWQSLEKITQFLKKFWTFTGQYDPTTSRKFIPNFTYQELIIAADSAFANGADFGVSDQSQLHAKIDSLREALFDPNYMSIQTNKSPTPPDDILTGSAVNEYNNVTLKEVQAFHEQYPLNSRLVKDEHGIHEEVYRAGNPEVPPGRMAEKMADVVEELDQARLLARPSQRNALTHLINYFETGDPKEFREFNIAWVADQSPVDFTIGFIEVYNDPRAQKGTYEGIVYFVDSTHTDIMQRLATNASTFEEMAPWDSAYKRTEHPTLVGRAVNLVTGVGDGGPLSPYGINLPNEESLREKYGSKSIVLTNIGDANDIVWGNALTREFAENEDVIKQWEKWGEITGFLMAAMHEIIGHGSGKLLPELEGNDAGALGEYSSALEEARADLVALYFINRPISRTLDIVPDKACGEAAYRHYARGDLVDLGYMGDINRLEEDHARGHHMIVEYLRLVSGAIDTVRKDGKLYLVVNDIDKMQQGVGELLAKVMKIKATGDYQGAKYLFETYGVKVNSAWRDECQARVKTLDLPKYAAYVMPELTLEALPLGKVTDVTITYPRDFVAQMLMYSGDIPVKP